MSGEIVDAKKLAEEIRRQRDEKIRQEVMKAYDDEEIVVYDMSIGQNTATLYTINDAYILPDLSKTEEIEKLLSMDKTVRIKAKVHRYTRRIASIEKIEPLDEVPAPKERVIITTASYVAPSLSIINGGETVYIDKITKNAQRLIDRLKSAGSSLEVLIVPCVAYEKRGNTATFKRIKGIWWIELKEDQKTETQQVDQKIEQSSQPDQIESTGEKKESEEV